MRRSPLSAALLLAFTTGCVSVRPRPSEDPLEQARAFLRAWSEGDEQGLGKATLNVASEVQGGHRRFQEDLRLLGSRFSLGRVTRRGAAAMRVSFHATHLLRGLGEWEVESELRLERGPRGWGVRWSPSVLHPSARAGDRFARARERPPRAALLDGRGRPLTQEGEVVTVGLEPRRVRRAGEVIDALRRELGVDEKRLEALLARGGDRFLPVIDLRVPKFEKVRAPLEPVPGIFFRRRQARLTPAEGFAAATLGRVGEVTAEALSALGPLYQAGDEVGLSGLERAWEVELAGAPSGEVRLVDRSGTSRPLFRFPGRAGTEVQTTLLPEVQQAAEFAISGSARPTALVALDARSGAVLAVAQGPASEGGVRALTGLYPPGSTFKVVTTDALLESGLTPQARLTCPAQATVGGKVFRNHEGEALGAVTLRTAFAHSCNTAFVAEVERVGASALTAASRRFGFGVVYRPGLPSPGATFPPPNDAAELAAASIGQGRVLATPLHMASVAAAVATGTWRAPYLVDSLRSGPSSDLSPGAAAPLRSLMRAVVTEGTGRLADGAPGLAGKTGTAEYGREVPPRTHAWFIGFAGEVAFAVLVEDGGLGGKVAAPIAGRFTRELEAR